MGYNETLKKNNKDLYILRWDKYQDIVSEKSKDELLYEYIHFNPSN